MRKIVLLFTVLLTGSMLAAQNSFSRYIGGDVIDEGRAVIRDGNNYIIAAVTRSYGAPYLDIMIVRTDTMGAPLLTKYYKSQMGDDLNMNVTEVADMCMTSDGNYALTGWSTYSVNSPNGVLSYGSAFYIKIDPSLNILLSKFYTTGPGTGAPEPKRIKSDGQGNIYITGMGSAVSNNNGSFNIMKIDEQTGTLQWSKNFVNITLIGAESGTGYDIEFLSDTGGNLIAAGQSDEDVFLIKLDPSGQVLWSKLINTPAQYEGIKSIGLDGNSNIICGGAIGYGSSTGLATTMLMSVAANGSLNWIKNFQGDAVSDYLLATGINVLPGGIYAAGNMTHSPSASTWSPNQVHYFKTDLNGNLAWSRMFGDTANKTDEAFRSFTTANNDWGFIGWSDAFRPPTLDTYKGIVFVKPGSNGELCNYSQSLPHSLNDITAAISPYFLQVQLQVLADSLTEETAAFTTHTTQLYTQNICTGPSGIEEAGKADDLIIAPNPASNTIRIEGMSESNFTVQLYSFDGKLIIRETNSTTLDVSHLSAGIYMLNLVTENGNTYNRKLIKE